MSTPRNLVPLQPANTIHALCDRIAVEMPDNAIVVMLELAASRRLPCLPCLPTPPDANRLVRALRHVAGRDDLAAQVEALLN